MTVIPFERPHVSSGAVLRTAFWVLIAVSLAVPYALGL
jgi:hypothetical protein